MITINFHSTSTKPATIIRYITKSDVNHVSIQVNDVVYEAQMKRGVVSIPETEFNRSTITKSYSFEGLDEKTCQEFLQKQVGKDYDWFGVFSFVWRHIEQTEGEWYCSELAIVAIMKAFGIPSEAYSQRVSPQDMLNLLELIYKIINFQQQNGTINCYKHIATS